jgi:anti-sigma B factor antagonist
MARSAKGIRCASKKLNMHRTPRLYDVAATAVLSGFDRVRSVVHRGFRPRDTTPSAPPRRAVDESSNENPCTVTQAANECCLRIEGVLDTHSAPEIRSWFDCVVTARRPLVIVDLERLTRIDSSGVGALVSLHKRVKAYGGCFVVKGLQDQPLAVCKLLKLDRVFARAPFPARPLISLLHETDVVRDEGPTPRRADIELEAARSAGD